MTISLQSQIFFALDSSPVVSEIKFVGLGFYVSLLVLWLLIQGLVRLAARFSTLINPVDWWRSAVLALVCVSVMIAAWSFPSIFTKSEEDKIVIATTSAMVCGAIAAWFLSGRLYQFEWIHRVIVSVGIAGFVLPATEVGRMIQWSLLGS